MINDKYNKNDGYMVRTLYFDTIDNTDFTEKLAGVEKRKKVRLRVYDPNDESAYLEVKRKSGQYQVKKSLKIKREDAIKLINKEYDVLLKYDDPFALECYTILKEEFYIPRAVIQYQRKAYIAKENKIRITFDSNILSTESNFNIFDENLLLYPVFPKHKVIMEVKYNGFLLSYIKNLINGCEKSPIAVSKYCLARYASLNYTF